MTALSTLLVTMSALAAPAPARDSAPPFVRAADRRRGLRRPGRHRSWLGGTTERRLHRDPRGRRRRGRARRARARARRCSQTIRSVTQQPVKWLVLTHHHPDHHFGAIVFRRAGAKVIAHPDTRVLASEGGPDALVADWVRVVGLDAMHGFEFANVPDRPVTAADTLRMGGRTIVITHPGAGHSAGDLMVWLPKERVLFAGDLLIEDGVTMVVDGSARRSSRSLARIDSLRPRVAVPGHGALPESPGAAGRAHAELHHRPRRPTCGRRSRRACRCSARSPRCRRRTRTGRCRSTRAGGGTRRACTSRRSASYMGLEDSLP